MKKRIVMVSLFVLVCVISASAVYAKSLLGKTLNGGNTVITITRDNTGPKLHTSLYPTSINDPDIEVENTVYRPKAGDASTWVKKGQSNFTVTKTNYSYIYNIDLKTAEKTRTHWQNKESGTRIVGNFYLNNDYDYN